MRKTNPVWGGVSSLKFQVLRRARPRSGLPADARERVSGTVSRPHATSAAAAIALSVSGQ